MAAKGKLNVRVIRSIFNISWRDEEVLAKKYSEDKTPADWEKILKENKIPFTMRSK